MSVRPLVDRDQTSQSAAGPGPHRSGRTPPPGAADVDTEGTNTADSPVIPGNRIQPKTAEASVYAGCADDCHAEGRGFESHQPFRERPPPLPRFPVLSRRSDEDVYRTRGASSWFKHNGAADSLDRAGESFRGACEWVGRANVDVELAVRERGGEQA
jgi:hypothetical protein